jgi:hypothetical protein
VTCTVLDLWIVCANAAYIILQDENNIHDMIMKVEKVVRMYVRINKETKLEVIYSNEHYAC